MLLVISCGILPEPCDGEVFGLQIEHLLCVSLVVLGFDLEFGYIINHNCINLITVLIAENLLQRLSYKIRATGTGLGIEEGKNKVFYINNLSKYIPGSLNQ